MSQIEIPQRSSLLPGVLSFRFKAREALAVKRREFIALLGGAAAAGPLTARAQQPAMPVVGFLGVDSPDPISNRVAAFRKGLSDVGYVEGRNVTIEFRWAHNDSARLPEVAAELVNRPVSVIAAPGSVLAALAAKAATRTIPIVFQVAVDAVEVGLVASFSRPGGNVTGVSSMNQEIAANQLELICELAARSHAFRRARQSGQSHCRSAVQKHAGVSFGPRAANRGRHRRYQPRHRRGICDPCAKTGRGGRRDWW